MDISERIKVLRKELGLNQTQFGKTLGVSRDVVNNLENSRLKRPDQKEPLFKLICSQFNVNEAWLRTGDGAIFHEPVRKNLIMDFAIDVIKEDSFRTQFVELLAQMTPEEWELVEKMARRLTEGKEKG